LFLAKLALVKGILLTASEEYFNIPMLGIDIENFLRGNRIIQRKLIAG
jgi:hypothetical protein